MVSLYFMKLEKKEKKVKKVKKQRAQVKKLIIL